MNKHLKLVREFNETLSFPQAAHGADVHLSDMDIVMHQALLMEEGSTVLKAIKAGEMVQILAGLVNLAYTALGAIAMRGTDVTDQPVTWRHDGFVVSIMRILSEKIHNCTSGSTDDYSEVYCLCVHLTRSFINADFDKALQMIHEGKLSKPVKAPDLSECLYE
ncbi:MAG: hypothetical protein EPN17_17025 [Methylobacter sp.]|nr:MAG: hypothetical protein EPN17_17025 [Methylobacter sp.]